MSRYAKWFIDGLIVARLMLTSLLGFERFKRQEYFNVFLGAMDRRSRFNSIQLRRMRARDLESQVDLPESKHEYEDTLDLIKLPLPIPMKKKFIAPQF